MSTRQPTAMHTPRRQVANRTGVLLVFASVLLTTTTVFADDAKSLADRYGGTADRIIAAVKADNSAYAKLEALCDGIGNRISGSPALDRAIEWAVRTLKADGQENVHTEKAMVPKWVRGAESLELIEPYPRTVPMLGLGGSVATPPEGITAEVLVVHDEMELEQRSDEARGKIVLFDYPMSRKDEEKGAGYDDAVRFRVGGARWAAEHGAVAALVRSVTTRSFQSPHTGGMHYGDDAERIPTAAISTEYAGLFHRLQEDGTPIKVTLKMEAKTEEPAPSANVIAELRGREKPDEIVLISGHLDSWDVGQGAHDDGGGCVTAMEAINVLRKLGLQPRRTIRVVLWTNEENGTMGARTYAKEHADELANHVVALEHDSGVFAPLGFGIEIADNAASRLAIEQMSEICGLLKSVRKLTAYEGYAGADVGHLRAGHVPLIGQDVDMTHYFDIHHTEADTLDKVDPDELTDNVAVLAVTAYILADMQERFAAPPVK